MRGHEHLPAPVPKEQMQGVRGRNPTVVPEEEEEEEQEEEDEEEEQEEKEGEEQEGSFKASDE